MTTITMSSPHRINFLSFFKLLLASFLLVGITVTSHAVIRHGNDALDIRDCLDRNGDFQTWISISDPDKFFRICELSPDNFGLQIVKEEKFGFVEKTAFIKGEGSWGELIQYLEKIAIKYNGVLPWS